MSYAARIIEKFRGTRPMAAALGLPPSTIQSWKDSGFIPAKHQQQVLDTAIANGIDLSPADFFEPKQEAAQGGSEGGSEGDPPRSAAA